MCDAAIEAHLQRLIATVAAPATPLLPARTKPTAHDNAPRFDMRMPLHQLTGVDLSQIDGIGPYTALRLLSEIGTDMTRWPTVKHFTSWLTLAPQNKISGGRLLSSRTQPSANRAGAMLRLAAMTLGRTQTALGAFFRRLAFRVGRAKATHRDRTQARHPRVSHTRGRPRLRRPRRRRLRRPAPHARAPSLARACRPFGI